MKTRKIFNSIAVIACASVLSVEANAQGLNSAYYLSGYNHRSELNPAFAAEHSYITFPALGNVNVSMRGNLGMNKILYDMPNGDLTTFMNSCVSASDFLSGLHSKNKISADMKVELLSAGFKGFGGFNTIGVSVRSNASVNVPYEMFEFMKNTQNKVYNIDGLSAHADAFAEFSIGHSHKIGKNLRIGANLKFLVGGANVDAKVTGMQASLLEDKWSVKGNAVVDASIKGLEYETETKTYNDGSTYNQVKDASVHNTGINGFGLAVDLGAEYDLSDVVPGLSVNAALLDLGFINWKNDYQASNNGSSFEFDGFNDVAVDDKSSDKSVGSQWDAISDDLKDFAHLTDNGDQGSRTKSLAATVNVGAKYVLQSYKQLSFGLLSTTRLNGDYSWTEARVSANVAPVKCLEVSASYAFSTFGSSIGAVANLHAKGFNLTLGTDHVIGKMCKQGVPLSSNGTVNVGISLPM